MSTSWQSDIWHSICNKCHIVIVIHPSFPGIFLLCSCWSNTCYEWQETLVFVECVHLATGTYITSILFLPGLMSITWMTYPIMPWGNSWLTGKVLTASHHWEQWTSEVKKQTKKEVKLLFTCSRFPSKCISYYTPNFYFLSCYFYSFWSYRQRTVKSKARTGHVLYNTSALDLNIHSRPLKHIQRSIRQRKRIFFPKS